MLSGTPSILQAAYDQIVMQNPSEIFLSAILVGLEVSGKSLEVTSQMVQKVPVVRLVYDRMLDSVFGPEDEHEYVSTTSPSSPPPPHPQK